MSTEQKERYWKLMGEEYLTEKERDELDALILVKRSDPDFNQDEWLNNR